MDGSVLVGALMVPKWLALTALVAAFPMWLGVLLLLRPQQRVPGTAKSQR